MKNNTQIRTNVQNTKNIETDPIKILYKTFPPNIEDVKCFCQDYNINIDIDYWFNYYESVGWKIGKNKMQDWRCSVKNWAKTNLNKTTIIKKEENIIVMDDYMELLKHPKWQRKRLEIMQRDEFKCRSCTDDQTTLHVHHMNYNMDLYPWEYKNEDLITLCETCHEAWHYLLKHKTIGLETFVLIMRLYDSLESESIDKFITEWERNNPR